MQTEKFRVHSCKDLEKNIVKNILQATKTSITLKYFNKLHNRISLLTFCTRKFIFRWGLGTTSGIGRRLRTIRLARDTSSGSQVSVIAAASAQQPAFSRKNVNTEIDVTPCAGSSVWTFARLVSERLDAAGICGLVGELKVVANGKW